MAALEGTIARTMARAVPAQELLKALPLFKALDAASLARLAEAVERRPVRRGERVFRRGDRPTGLYVLVYGQVRLLGPGRAGGQRLTGVVEPGHSFGEPVMFLDRPALVDAEAATDCLVLHLPKEVVFAEIERSPRFARRLLAGLSSRVEAMVRQAERQDLGGGRERLADYLLRQAGKTPAEPFTLPASKAAIAAHLLLTPEHLSRLLRELVDEGHLRMEGRRLTLLQPQRLAARARSASHSGPS